MLAPSSAEAASNVRAAKPSLDDLSDMSHDAHALRLPLLLCGQCLISDKGKEIGPDR